MKIDSSKITFKSESGDDLMIYELENVKFTSNRQHTLLFQSTRKFVSTGTGSGNSSNIPENSQMSKLTFLNVFDNHKPEDIEKLDRLFLECKGNIPSRRQLSAIAQSIGIQQSKIKKWFDKRNLEQNQIIQKGESYDIWNEINDKLDKIDNEISSIESRIK